MENQKTNQGEPGVPPPAPVIPLALNLLARMIQRDLLAKEVAELRETCSRGLYQKSEGLDEPNVEKGPAAER